MTARDDATSPSLDDEGMPDLEGPLPGKAATGDPQEGLTPPADAPHASVDFGTTAEEQRHGESLDLRLSRENPDTAATDAGDVPVLVGDPLLDDQEERLVDVDASGDPALGRSAEEEAVHVIDER